MRTLLLCELWRIILVDRQILLCAFQLNSVVQKIKLHCVKSLLGQTVTPFTYNLYDREAWKSCVTSHYLYKTVKESK